MDRRDNSGDTTTGLLGTEGRLGPEIWAHVRDDIRGKIPDDDFVKWIGDIKFIAEVDGSMLIAARDRLSFDRVHSEHRRMIEHAWSKHDPKHRALRFECWGDASRDIRTLVDNPWAKVARPRAGSAMTFDTLVVGPSNENATTLAHRIANGDTMPAPIALLYGPQGVGKTHIMRALETAALGQDPERNVIYMTAEEFMARYHAGVKKRDTSELKASLRTADLVLIDDLQWIAGKPGTDTEFFANIRAVTSAGGKIVLTADQGPGDLRGFSPQMRSELKGAASVEIGMPDQDMRREIVRIHADLIAAVEPNFQLDDQKLDRIVRRVHGPGRNLCGALWSLHTETGFGKRAPTMEMLDRVILRQEGSVKVPTIDAIKRAAMQVFSVTKADLESPCKEQVVVYPRQISMYLCRMLTSKSFPQIGRGFGGRDHTTVLYAVRKIERRMAEDPDIANDVERVAEALREMQASDRA